MKQITLLSVLLMLVSPLIAVAQDDDDEILSYSVWVVTDVDAEVDAVEDDSVLPNEVVVISLDDGETLLIIWAGSDIIYTRQDDGTYSGAELVAGGGYEFEATLEIIDDNTMQSDSVVQTGSFTSETTLRYALVEDEDIAAQLYVEGEREIVEFSQFQECLGRTDVTVGRAWTRSDLLVPMRFTDDGLIWNEMVFEGGGGVYINERTEEFSSFENLITQTFTATGEGNFDYNSHAIADGRDDCEMIYNSSYAPFDGDFEAIFAMAEELSAAED